MRGHAAQNCQTKTKVVLDRPKRAEDALTAALSFEIEMSLEVALPQTHRHREETHSLHQSLLAMALGAEYRIVFSPSEAE